MGDQEEHSMAQDKVSITNAALRNLLYGPFLLVIRTLHSPLRFPQPRKISTGAGITMLAELV
jgi:hypothetical protein